MEDTRGKDIKEVLSKVIQEAADYYMAGERKMAWRTIERDASGHRFSYAIWPNSVDIDVTVAVEEQPYGDVGTRLGSISLENFGVDSVVFLTAALIDSWKAD